MVQPFSGGPISEMGGGGTVGSEDPGFGEGVPGGQEKRNTKGIVRSQPAHHQGLRARPNHRSRWYARWYVKNKKRPKGACFLGLWRRERDSNPRYCIHSTPDFESGAFDHSAISPRWSFFWRRIRDFSLGGGRRLPRRFAPRNDGAARRAHRKDEAARRAPRIDWVVSGAPPPHPSKAAAPPARQCCRRPVGDFRARPPSRDPPPPPSH